eukprot:CAMPEP_0201594964 /NCGR_PEP_ID=MMETSP0190_2-20130828/192116_1 /ASSEMBLY_ACC=CAM_ASM_000263 /TAXON_ID=37353 /ORGANISM="Rosalina sp." /LENGTH=82 /DNA_ID=CAMNT_0048054773 /DNA_START=1284 /DNA_END=1532 /DNA_ORIENTATION=-
MAFDSFAPSADLEESMVIGSNKDYSNNNIKDDKKAKIVKTPERQYKKRAVNDKDDDEKVEVHVNSEILDDDEDSSHQSTPVR